jgi:CheY-like chemotaxis protein
MNPLATKFLHKRLFIIDDDVEDQEILMEALREIDNSVECYTSTSGEDALRQMEKQVVVLPDLIFLDMNMPKLNGKQVLKELKDSEITKSIPVIMYSTSFAPRDIEEIDSLGAAFYLVKPSGFDALCKSLSMILAKPWR